MENRVHKLGINSRYVLAAILAAFVLPVLFLGGCSTTPKHVKEARQTVREAYEVQKPLVVVTSEKDDRPEWTKKTVFERDGSMFFTGGFLNGSGYSLTVRCANAEALKVAIQSISPSAALSW